LMKISNFIISFYLFLVEGTGELTKQ
jgi:hypothetical protein